MLGVCECRMCLHVCVCVVGVCECVCVGGGGGGGCVRHGVVCVNTLQHIDYQLVSHSTPQGLFMY